MALATHPAARLLPLNVSLTLPMADGLGVSLKRYLDEEDSILTERGSESFVPRQTQWLLIDSGT